MDNLTVVVYTMKTCPHCTEFKNLLKKESINFIDRDIDKFEDEYDMFSKITENEMVPAVLVIEGDEKKHQSYLYAPERNYNELTEAVDLIKRHQKKLGLI
jgi:glutaredoxin